MQRSRNVVLSLWFAVFAMTTFLVPPANVVFLLFWLVLGLALPLMVYLLWHDIPVAASLVVQSTDHGQRQATGNR
jgi:hypothetical protein